MRAVVTGGAGFIGSHLIERLAARGDDIVCVERPGASRRWIADVPLAWEPVGLEDESGLARVLEGADVVFHLAALTEARRYTEYYAVNTEGTASVLRAAARFNGSAPRVVFPSSLAALGPCRDEKPLSPDSIPFPITHYGNSKLLAEAAVHAFADRVPAAILRLSAVYGAREKAVGKLFGMIRRGVALTVGSWDRTVSLLYVKDAVQGLLAAADTERAAGRTYCLAHPETVTWAEFACAAGEALGRAPRLVSVPLKAAQAIAVLAELCARGRRRAAIVNRERVREMSQRRWVCDPASAIAEIGFDPRYPMERGLGETIAWFGDRNWQ